MNANSIVQSSPAPLEDSLSKYNTLYPVFAVIGVVVGLIGDATWYYMGLIGLLPALLFKSIIATKKTYDLQS